MDIKHTLIAQLGHANLVQIEYAGIFWSLLSSETVD